MKVTFHGFGRVHYQSDWAPSICDLNKGKPVTELDNR